MDLDQSFGESEGRCRESDTAGGGELLHARREVRGLAHGGVVHVQATVNRPHHHFPRVEAHASLQLHTVGAADLFSVAAQGGLHGQSGIAGPHRVVFMGYWSAEERHDAIA
jgi:hypothetical protein